MLTPAGWIFFFGYFFFKKLIIYEELDHKAIDLQIMAKK